ncbi:MAG: amidohydrolase family protein [Ginsengibacter sp.]
MTYLKFKADQLFTGSELLSGEQVLITKAGGEIVDTVHQSEAGEDILYSAGILSPGFINCHCHLELSHMKHLIEEKTGLVDFVVNVVSKRNFPDEEILEAIQNAEDEMLTAGIVAIGDICNNLSTLPQKMKRRMTYYNFIEASGWVPKVAMSRFEASNFFYETFSNHFKETSMAPHAAYSVSPALWQLIVPFFENKVTTLHNQETPHEDEFFLKGAGPLMRMYELMNIDNSFHRASEKSSLDTVYPYLSAASSLILVHNTFTTERDITRVKNKAGKKHLVSFCLCVNANLYIEDALPPVELLVQNDCAIVLGTDSLASNHTLNLLAEMKTIRKNFPRVSLLQMLTWATINGAKALQIDNTYGSFSKGKKPGVVLIEGLDENNLGAGSSCKRLI